MKIGLALPQSSADGDGGSWREIAALAAQAEAGGLDSLWVSDHFFYRAEGAAVGTETGYHEAWTILSALAASTDRVELGTLVLATSFRSPGLLAKMAATLDEVSGGRLILGLGCGWHEPEYRAFGFPFDHRVGRFAEAIGIIAPLVRGDRITLEGEFERVDEAQILPPPIRRSLPILVAAKGERMLRLTARHADAWQTAWFGRPDDRYRDRQRDLLAACQAEGRDPSTLEITVGIDIGNEPTDSADAVLPLDPSAIAAAFRAWDEAGAGHLQIALRTATRASLGVLVEATADYRRGVSTAS